MRIVGASEQDCPDCGGHPPLIYADSTGPDENGSRGHSYVCALCGLGYRQLTPGGPLIKNQRDPNIHRKECPTCGKPMTARLIAGVDVPAAGVFDGRTHRAEQVLEWICECGMTDELKVSDVLGFN